MGCALGKLCISTHYYRAAYGGIIGKKILRIRNVWNGSPRVCVSLRAPGSLHGPEGARSVAYDRHCQSFLTLICRLQGVLAILFTEGHTLRAPSAPRPARGPYTEADIRQERSPRAPVCTFPREGRTRSFPGRCGIFLPSYTPEVYQPLRFRWRGRGWFRCRGWFS